MFTRFDRIHERERQTDKQTDTARRRRPRLCIVSRGKKNVTTMRGNNHNYGIMNLSSEFPIQFHYCLLVVTHPIVHRSNDVTVELFIESLSFGQALCGWRRLVGGVKFDRRCAEWMVCELMPVTHGNTLSSAEVAAAATTDDVAYDVAWLPQHSMEEFPRCNQTLYTKCESLRWQRHYPTHASTIANSAWRLIGYFSLLIIFGRTLLKHLQQMSDKWPIEGMTACGLYK